MPHSKHKNLILSAALGVLFAPTGLSQQITEILDSTGDGVNGFDAASRVALDSAGNVYATAITSNNVFRVTPAGVITQVLDSTGDGSNPLLSPSGIAAGANGNVYVLGTSSNNCFEIGPLGAVTEIIDSTGDGAGNPLLRPSGCCVGPSGNVFVAGSLSNNVFRITPGGMITEIMDSTGDGTHTFSNARGIAVDAAENVYVISGGSTSAFKITPAGAITQIIDASGDGMGNILDLPFAIAANAAGNVYVTGTDNVFMITPAGVISEIVDHTGDGAGHPLITVSAVAVNDVTGNVYASGAGFFWGGSNNVLQITPAGAITQILSGSGDGMGATLNYPIGIAVDALENVFVVGFTSNNVFRVEAGFGDLGANYCMANPNSTGAVGTLTATGQASAAANDVTLTAGNLPANQFGIFVVSTMQGFVASPTSMSNGNVCLDGAIGRYNTILSAGVGGTFSLPVDLTAVPAGGATLSIVAGDTLNFQAWHRDGVGLGSNFTEGLSITFN